MTATSKKIRILALTLVLTVYAIFSPFFVLNVYSELKDCVNFINHKCDDSWRFENRSHDEVPQKNLMMHLFV